MNKRLVFLSTAFLLGISYLFSGCYFYETITFTINPQAKTGNIEIANLYSVADSEDNLQKWSEEEIQTDFDLFISDFEKDSLHFLKNFNGDMRFTNKKLYKYKKQLNAKIDFKFEQLETFFEIDQANKELRIYKNRDIESTNGTLKEDSYYVWPMDTKNVVVKFNASSVDPQATTYSLLPYWKKWKKQS